MPSAAINPTRQELTRLKERLRTARRGHKLLKDKRDEMMRRCLETVRESRALRREVEEAEGEISAILARHNRGERSRPVKEALERAAAKERSGPGSGRKR